MNEPLPIDEPLEPEPGSPDAAVSLPPEVLEPAEQTLDYTLPLSSELAPEPVPTLEAEEPVVRARGLVEGSLPAIFIIGASVLIYLFLWAYVVPTFKVKWMFDHEKSFRVTPDSPGMPSPKSFPAIIMTGFYVLCALTGCGAAFCAMIAYGVSREARAWLERQLFWLAERPQPAIHLLDVVAIFLLYASLHPVFVILLHQFGDFHAKDLITPVLMLGNDLAMASAVGGAIWIARFRARGDHGSRGFWPAWSGDFIAPARPVWMDVLLGFVTFPLVLWVAMLVGIENKFLVNQPDKHPIIAEFASHPRPAVIVIFVLTGTLGAAILEETLFRGILYNAMRRFMGGPSAALASAFLFAWVHGLKSDLLGLFVLGLAMTWLYDKTGRLLAGMVFHFTNNLVSLLMTLALFNQ